MTVADTRFRNEHEDEVTILFHLLSACLNATVHMFCIQENTFLKTMIEIIAD
jgi:hypothetical protein